MTAAAPLDAATAFLAEHRGHVPLITIAIGANDVLTCLAGAPDVINACVQQQLPIVQQELTLVMAQLRAVDPRATIVGMTYADPALGAWPSCTTTGKRNGEHRMIIHVELGKRSNALWSNL